ncbi:acyltransferase [Nocardiopsis sp. TSRI0078]|uniref:acyltransferase family protein n=1 Tax=unclassified Nocardiopsis TaxID=2649073 RepID=UPI00093C6CBC|nr:acyltransferase family protein [Nocardiopsis sp. TSRI0078]OKI22924.1 acyltransferase [Nocardiopsis sp. TSRI0078]
MTQHAVPPLGPDTAAPPPGRRLHHVDNLRAALTVLVVLHHVAVTYGNIPVWFYTESAQDPSGGLLDLFVIVNQTYFMGLFFLLAGYFVPGAADRRGRRGLVRERLVRLGVPLLLFVLLLRPLATAHVYPAVAEAAAAEGSELPYWLFYLISFDPGPMWFVEVLLVLTLAYVMIRGLRERRARRAGLAVGPPARPADGAPLRWPWPVLGFTLGLALATFVWRYLAPAPYWPFVGLPSPGYLPQYLALFTVGVLAYRGNWLTRLPGAAGWFGAALSAAGLLALPLVTTVLGEAALTPGTWQALAQIVVETCFAVGTVLMLLVFFRRFLNRGNRLTRFLSENAFAVYFLHPLVLVGLGLALSGWEAVAIIKFAAVGAVALPACWLLAAAVRAVPGARRIL